MTTDNTSDPTAFGLPLDVGSMPDDFIPLEVVVVVKGLDSQGKTAIAWTATKDLNMWEAAGMVVFASDAIRHEMQCDCGDDD